MRKFQVLVVDDYEKFRQFISSALLQSGRFEVTQASDGEQALQEFWDMKPDLVLLDIGLPRLNGIEVARQLGPNARILFLSQESSADVVQEALSLGAGYVHKQHAQSELLPAVETVLAGRRFVSRSLELSESLSSQHSPNPEVLFCSDEGVLLDSLTRFVATALKAGNAAVVWAREAHRHSLMRRLLAESIDIESALRTGTFVSLDVSEHNEPDGILRAIGSASEAAAKLGKNRPRVAVCCERTGRFSIADKTNGAIRLEQLFFNQLTNTHDIDVLCVYPLYTGGNDDQALKWAYAQHSAVYSQ